jgi:hypothetical protein
VPQCEHLYLNSNEHLRQGNEVETREAQEQGMRAQFPLHSLRTDHALHPRARRRKWRIQRATRSRQGLERVCGS